MRVPQFFPKCSAMRSRKRNPAWARPGSEWTRFHHYLLWDDAAERAVAQGSTGFDFSTSLSTTNGARPARSHEPGACPESRIGWLVWDKAAPPLGRAPSARFQLRSDGDDGRKRDTTGGAELALYCFRDGNALGRQG